MHLAALVFGLQLVAHADDGGNAHGAGQYRRVAGAAAALGDEGQYLALVQLHGLRRGQVVRRQDHGHGAVDAALHHAGQYADDAAGDVLHVGGAGLHIGVVHLGEHVRELGGDVGDGGLGVQLFILDQALDGLDVVVVLGHHLVGLEQERGLLAGLLEGLFIQLAQLVDGLFLGGLEAVPLGRGVLHLDAADDALRALVVVQRPHGHAGGYALALDRNHFFHTPFSFILSL